MMSTQEDVRQIALSLPGVRENPDHFSFFVTVKNKAKGFAWIWMERVEPKKPRLPNPEVVAILVANLTTKALLMEESPDKFIVDPHYANYPAVLVKLPEISRDELEDLLIEGWKTKASSAMINDFLANDAIK